MEERIIPADSGARLARLEAADQANEYLYQVLDIGQYMLQSGGEVSRVEDSIRRLCLAFGAERADVFTITSSIVVTIYSPAFGALTQTRRVSGQQYDLNRLEKLTQLSRRICAEHLSLEETRQALKEICQAPQYGFGLGESVDMISIGNIMLLIPGIPLTNSLRDMFSGNTISGMMRFLEAIIMALVIAFGFALVAAMM